MRVAIIAGSGIYDICGITLKEKVIDTPYGQAKVYLGHGDADNLVFLTRQGPEHNIPPHRINYRANIKALQILGVKKILAAFAVGSIKSTISPSSLAVLSDFLDFTSGRDATFFNGGYAKTAYTEMSTPFCPALSRQLLEFAPEFELKVHPNATYVATNGPRFETPAEVRMFGKLGGDVVGMTGVPEFTLSRELNMHYAAVALSINWAAGIKKCEIEFIRDGIDKIRSRLLALFIKTLQTPIEMNCSCQRSVMMMNPQKNDTECSERWDGKNCLK